MILRSYDIGKQETVHLMFPSRYLLSDALPEGGPWEEQGASSIGYLLNTRARLGCSSDFGLHFMPSSLPAVK